MADMSRLIGINYRAVQDFAARNILVRSPGRGLWMMQSVTSYCEHLRKLAQGHATSTGTSLADERALRERTLREIDDIKLRQMKGEFLQLDDVSQAWAGLARMFRIAVMSVPGKARASLPHLTAHDTETMKQLCREVLENLSEEIEGDGALGATPEELLIKTK